MNCFLSNFTNKESKVLKKLQHNFCYAMKLEVSYKHELPKFSILTKSTMARTPFSEWSSIIIDHHINVDNEPSDF